VSSSAARLIANSLRIASSDLEAARALLATNNRNAVYFCQQAAEKVILAVLTSEGKHGGIRHHLDAMVDLVSEENPIKPLLRSIEALSAYATTYRYPTSAGRIPPAPPAHSVKDWVEKVDVTLGRAAAAFGVDLGGNDTPAKHAGPIR
jgi:HEPN domain-containing protein